MLYLKTCPRCRGYMVKSRADPSERACLQCGYVAYATPPLPFVDGTSPYMVWVLTR